MSTSPATDPKDQRCRSFLHTQAPGWPERAAEVTAMEQPVLSVP